MLDTNGYKPSNDDDEVVRKKQFYIYYTYRTSCLFRILTHDWMIVNYMV